MFENVDEMSKLAVEETGLGRVADKINKNILAIEKNARSRGLRTLYIYWR